MRTRTAAKWAVDALAKAGTISIVGVYSPNCEVFPIGKALNKNLTLNMGNCNHRRYIPNLLQLVHSGEVDPTQVFPIRRRLVSAIAAYESFDRRKPGWLKVELLPSMQPA